MVGHDIEGGQALRRGGGRWRRGHFCREQQAGRAGYGARPWRGPTTVTTRMMAAGARSRPPSLPPPERPRVCAGVRLPAPAGQPLDDRPGDRVSVLVESCVSSRRRSSSVSMLFPSSSCLRLVPRWPGQPGPRATGLGTVGMGLHRARRASEHRRCLLHRPVLPEPQHEHGPLLQRQPAAGTQQQLPVEHRRGGIARHGSAVRSGERVSACRCCRARHRSLTRLSRTVLLYRAGDCRAAGQRPAVRNRACWTRSSASCRLPTSKKAKPSSCPPSRATKAENSASSSLPSVRLTLRRLTLHETTSVPIRLSADSTRQKGDLSARAGCLSAWRRTSRGARCQAWWWRVIVFTNMAVCVTLVILWFTHSVTSLIWAVWGLILLTWLATVWIKTFILYRRARSQERPASTRFGQEGSS